MRVADCLIEAGPRKSVRKAPGATTVILALAAFLAISVGAATWRVLRRHTRAAPEVEPPDVVLQKA